MSSIAPERSLIQPGPDDVEKIKAVMERLNENETIDPANKYYLQDESGNVKMELPPSLFAVLRQAALRLAQGSSVMIVNYDHELTTQQAADLLNVSRPYLISLLESGKLRFHMVGSHRRIRFGDLMAYKDRRDALRRDHLNEIVRVSESLGLYEDGEQPGQEG